MLLRPDRTMELKDWKGKGCMMRDSPICRVEAIVSGSMASGVVVWRSAVLRLSCEGLWCWGCGEVRVYVNNMTVGGVGRNERTLW